MTIADSELIINADGSVFHLHIRPGQLADKVILVGDPDRVALFKTRFDTVECEGASREFVWMTGLYKDCRMTVLSTGIGADNIDIVMTELDALANFDFQTREIKTGHRTLEIVRLGTCGAIRPEIPLGAFILSHGCIGFDGLMNWYAGHENITDAAMEQSFVRQMNWPTRLQRPYFVHASQRLIKRLVSFTVPGLTVSAPGFYGPQGRTVRGLPLIPDLIDRLESFRYDDWKVTNIEMESASVTGFARLLGHEAVTVCCVIAHRYLKDVNTDYRPRIDELITKVMDALAQ